VRVLVLRHHEEDSAGLVADAFTARGASIATHLHPDDGPLPSLGDYDHVVVLGSKWSVYDTEAVGPWVDDELDWLRRAASGPLPVLGICFGAQLLTAAFGGTVERAPTYEIGWVTVDPVPSANGAPFIGAGPWFQFHGDCCRLPAGARLLAANDVGVQAFSIGRSLGVQFHPEVDAAQLERWYAHGGRDVVEEAGRDPDELLAETVAQEDAARERADTLVATYLAHAGAGAPA
jgi:GMP synthase-like glutamine amidotransferase